MSSGGTSWPVLSGGRVTPGGGQAAGNHDSCPRRTSPVCASTKTTSYSGCPPHTRGRLAPAGPIAGTACTVFGSKLTAHARLSSGGFRPSLTNLTRTVSSTSPDRLLTDAATTAAPGETVAERASGCSTRPHPANSPPSTPFRSTSCVPPRAGRTRARVNPARQQSGLRQGRWSKRDVGWPSHQLDVVDHDEVPLLAISAKPPVAYARMLSYSPGRGSSPPLIRPLRRSSSG